MNSNTKKQNLQNDINELRNLMNGSKNVSVKQLLQQRINNLSNCITQINSQDQKILQKKSNYEISYLIN